MASMLFFPVRLNMILNIDIYQKVCTNITNSSIMTTTLQESEVSSVRYSMSSKSYSYSKGFPGPHRHPASVSKEKVPP